MDIEKQIYEDSYNSTYKNLKNRSGQSDFTVEGIKRELNSLYLYEDQDWTGRGEMKNLEIQGSIAAYQVFLHELVK